MGEITVRQGGRQASLPIEKGQTLLSAMQEGQIGIAAPCGGMGTCGRCKARFLGRAPEPTRREMELLTEGERARGVRLACQARPTAGDVIEAEAEELQDVGILQAADGGRDAASARAGEKSESTRLAQGSDSAARVLECHAAIKGAGTALAQGSDSTARVLECHVAIKGAGTARAGECIGAAVDIGTTTLAAVLISLPDGREMARASAANRQRAYGADVVSRIRAANEGKGPLLRARVRADVSELLGGMMAEAGIGEGRLSLIAIAGNTTMCHLLRGLSCRGLGEAPFRPVDLSLWEGGAGELLGSFEGARAIILPGASAYIGSDVVAGCYALGLGLGKSLGILLDIGTNGEMVLGDADGLFAASAAAGPVFEGGGISCGVPGIRGAVCRARMGETPADWELETVGGVPPIGLCGSGILDLAGELASRGILDENGTLKDPWFESGIPLAGGAFYFTQDDVREVQMGKAAIRAGIDVLMDAWEKSRDAPSPPDAPVFSGHGESLADPAEGASPEVFLAGGLGHRLSVPAAERIGLLPPWAGARARAVGNAALLGAERFLIDDFSGEGAARRRVASIAGAIREVSLADSPLFQERYISMMGF